MASVQQRLFAIAGLDGKLKREFQTQFRLPIGREIPPDPSSGGPDSECDLQSISVSSRCWEGASERNEFSGGQSDIGTSSYECQAPQDE